MSLLTDKHCWVLLVINKIKILVITKIEADCDKGCKLYNVVKSETIKPLRLIEDNKTKDPSHP